MNNLLSLWFYFWKTHIAHGPPHHELLHMFDGLNPNCVITHANTVSACLYFPICGSVVGWIHRCRTWGYGGPTVKDLSISWFLLFEDILEPIPSRCWGVTVLHNGLVQPRPTSGASPEWIHHTSRTIARISNR